MIGRRQGATSLGIAVTIALASAGCVAPSVQSRPGQARTVFHSALGRPLVLEGLTVTPLAVVEDSRCPANVLCVQAGTVRLNLKLSEMSAGRLGEIGLREPIRLASGSWLHLAAVCPTRLDPDPIDPGSYRFAFLISVAQEVGAAEHPCSQPAPF